MNYSMKTKDNLYSVVHQMIQTDNIGFGETIVSATSKIEAFNKLNDFLSTKPYGHWTPHPCKSIEDVHQLEVLE